MGAVFEIELNDCVPKSDEDEEMDDDPIEQTIYQDVPDGTITGEPASSSYITLRPPFCTKSSKTTTSPPAGRVLHADSRRPSTSSAIPQPNNNGPQSSSTSEPMDVTKY
ncbi:hypothetical protein M3Y99_01609500 [Aphelenchoides fujianensis]|nr:hypothetical protein M3Y99_01609500 [Aphelenchoides fujianensis]